MEAARLAAVLGMLGMLAMTACTRPVESGDARAAAPRATSAQVDAPTTTTTTTTTTMATRTMTTTTTTTTTTMTTTMVARTSATPTTADVTSTSTSTSTSTTVPADRTVTMAFTGDILPHSPLWRAAERYAAERGEVGHDFTPMLAALAPIFAQVDLAICHLETPIAPDGHEYSTHPRYAVPDGIAVAIADVGYDRCSTASNHTIDQGAAGIERTVRALEDNGIPQSGMARTPEEIEPTVFDAAGVAISHLSYTWSYNGLTLAPDEAWRSALIDPDRILADAATARRMGAELVVVSLHWGAEGHAQPTSYQRSVAETITAAGTVDLIVGHHAHVLQPIEQVNGTWVVYGLGNILSNLPTSSNFPDASQDAAVVTIDATVDADGNVEMSRPAVIPTWVDKDARWTVRVVVDELARNDLGAGQRGRLERSLERTRAVVGEFVAEGVSP